MNRDIVEAFHCLKGELEVMPRPWDADTVWWLCGALQGLTLALEAEQPALVTRRLRALKEGQEAHP